jgi:hypothetical protein
MKTITLQRNIICVMVSVGERSRLTDVTWPRLEHWCKRHGYKAVLLKEDLLKIYGYERPPHFNKCLVPKYFPGYDEYLILDDDLLFSKHAPEFPAGGADCFLMAKDPMKGITNAPFVQFNGNSGVLLVGKNKQYLFDRVFDLPVTLHGSPHTTCEGFTIWGPYDQGLINEVAFKEKVVTELDFRYNYSLVPEYWLNSNKQKWLSSRLHRMRYYFTLLFPFHRNARKMRKAYVLHLINCRFIAYVDFVYNRL